MKLKPGLAAFYAPETSPPYASAPRACTEQLATESMCASCDAGQISNSALTTQRTTLTALRTARYEHETEI